MLLLLAFTLSLVGYACTVANKPDKEDTIANGLLCAISIDDKEFFLPADSIATGYIFSDSSLSITIRGLKPGRLVITIPNLLKCPCKIPTGYSSGFTKNAGSNEYTVQSTVDLYSYPELGMSLNNLTDGQQHNDPVANAIEITGIQKTAENTDIKWAEYLIKGEIHTTVLKNVYDTTSLQNNKDYRVTGKFVIQAKIYL